VSKAPSTALTTGVMVRDVLGHGGMRTGLQHANAEAAKTPACCWHTPGEQGCWLTDSPTHFHSPHALGEWQPGGLVHVQQAQLLIASGPLSLPQL
jgi:hypothetical protein